jgi:hypothetical protein
MDCFYLTPISIRPYPLLPSRTLYNVPGNYDGYRTNKIALSVARWWRSVTFVGTAGPVIDTAAHHRGFA